MSARASVQNHSAAAPAKLDIYTHTHAPTQMTNISGITAPPQGDCCGFESLAEVQKCVVWCNSRKLHVRAHKQCKSGASCRQPRNTSVASQQTAHQNQPFPMETLGFVSTCTRNTSMASQQTEPATPHVDARFSKHQLQVDAR